MKRRKEAGTIDIDTFFDKDAVPKVLDSVSAVVEEPKQEVIPSGITAPVVVGWRDLKIGQRVELTIRGEVVKLSTLNNPYPRLWIRTGAGVKEVFPEDDPAEVKIIT